MRRYSVLISTYFKDSPRHLKECLWSLFIQSLPPYEVILVEDGPLGNGLLDVIDLFREKLNIVSVKLPFNAGLATALNLGLTHCSCEFIGRMDADDICHKDRFLNQVNYLVDNPAVDVVGCFMEVFRNELKGPIVRYPTEHTELRRFFCRLDPVPHPGVLFRTSFFVKAGFYNPKLLSDQDTELWYRGFCANAIFANIPMVLLFHRRDYGTFRRRSNFGRLYRYALLRVEIINNLSYGATGYLFLACYIFIHLIPGLASITLRLRR